MKRMTAIAALGTLALGACTETPATDTATAVTEAEAKGVVENFAKTAASMDLATIDSFYDDDVVAFDASDPNLIRGKVTIHVANARFVDQKFDKAEFKDPVIQIIAPNAFVATGVARLESSSAPNKNTDLRYTEVFKRQADGTWKSINEHIDIPKT